MEIKFNNLCYFENKSSSIEKKYLDNVTLSIETGSIVSFVNDDISILGSLLTFIKRPSSGDIVLDNVKITRTSHVNNSKLLRKKIGFLNMDTEVLFLESTVKKELMEVMKSYDCNNSNVEKRIEDSLKIAGLNSSYLDRKPNELSFTEQKKLKFACLMSYNPEVLVLNDFEKGLSYKEREYFRKLFLKLKSKFGKTIILLSRKLEFLFDVVDKVYVINKGKLVYDGNQSIFYEDELYRYIEMPKIVEFTKYLHNEGHPILEYTDFKELIKELYRKC